MIRQSISKQIWDLKYRDNAETEEHFYERIPEGLFGSLTEEEKQKYKNIIGSVDIKKHCAEGLKKHLYSLAGRGMFAVGTNRVMQTFSNCFVLPFKKDSLEAIMNTATESAMTMKAGGGVGYSLSILRPDTALISTSKTTSSGAVSFLKILDSTCSVIKAGNSRRGAQMGAIGIWHPSIKQFITCKRNGDLKNFNLSVFVSDEFMEAKNSNADWDLIFPEIEFEKYDSEWDGNIKLWKEKGYPVKVYETVKARELWDLIMKSNYNFAEPGILFEDIINKKNTLWWSEYIQTTNPCFTGDTIIAVADGRNGISIKELSEQNKEFLVYSSKKNKYRNSWKTEIKKAIAFKTGTKNVIRIKLSDGSEFRCTPEHLLALPDGKSYVEAKNSLGMEIEKFFTYSETKTKKSYRTINSISNGFARQYRMFWEYVNGSYDGTEFNIDHIDDDSTNDIIENLQILNIKEHKEKTKRNGLDNPVFRMNKEYFKLLNRRKLIQGNALKYNWTKERLNTELDNFDNSNYGKRISEIQELRNKPENILNEKVYVIDIIDNNEIEDVYDLTVEDNHNFNIITKTNDAKYLNCSGILVHNCAEQPLYWYGSCNLAPINLSNHVEKPFTDEAYINWELLEQSICTLVCMLDRMLDISFYPLEKQTQEVKSKRLIGLGFTALGDMFSKLKIKYNSEEAYILAEKIMKFISENSYLTSSKLAKEFGKFPDYDERILESYNVKQLKPEIIKHIKEYGLRNSRLTSIAPTGCLEGNTEITTNLGIYTLKELFEINNVQTKELEKNNISNMWFEPEQNIYVKTIDGPKKIKKLYFNGYAKTKKIYDKSGNLLIEGTLNHKIVVIRDNKELWIKLEDLLIGDIIKKY